MCGLGGKFLLENFRLVLQTAASLFLIEGLFFLFSISLILSHVHCLLAEYCFQRQRSRENLEHKYFQKSDAHADFSHEPCATVGYASLHFLNCWIQRHSDAQ